MKHNKSQGKNDDEYSSGRAVNVGIFIAIVVLVLFVVYLNFRSTDVNSEPPTVVFTLTLIPSDQSGPLAIATTPVIPPSSTSTKVSLATLTPTVFIVSNTQENFRAQISCREIEKANLRKSPGYVDKDDSKDVIVEIPCKQFVELLGQTKYVDGLTWWKVKWRDFEGWMSDHTGSGRLILVFTQPINFSQSNPKEFVFWYFNAIWQNRDYRYLWDNFLTSSFQNHSSSGDFNDYQ